jgi:hypothetical protein
MPLLRRLEHVSRNVGDFRFYLHVMRSRREGDSGRPRIKLQLDTVNVMSAIPKTNRARSHAEYAITSAAHPLLSSHHVAR